MMMMILFQLNYIIFQELFYCLHYQVLVEMLHFPFYHLISHATQDVGRASGIALLVINLSYGEDCVGITIALFFMP